jgi:DNA repair protein RadC
MSVYPQVKSEDAPKYNIEVALDKAEEDAIIDRALAIAKKRAKQYGVTIGTPYAARDYFTLRLAKREDQHTEVFSVAFLDSHHRLIAVEDIFQGSISQCMIYPREVVRRALHHNASSLVLSHNHPSGNLEPSQADKRLTQTLRDALALVDVTVVDHVICGEGNSLSMAENGSM